MNEYDSVIDDNEMEQEAKDGLVWVLVEAPLDKWSGSPK